ncbi:hypothetical protein ACD578_05390 [Microvirga sp. RSM25]|uniref:hypothetical protein n=1 Tax=Microvirga sp. RSM25 TaxID=3273802 RepID=UPI00384A6F70
MNRTRYVVTDPVAATRLLGRRLAPGAEVWLTDGEAQTPRDLGAVALPTPEAPQPEHPFDHDGNGRKGARRRRR